MAYSHYQHMPGWGTNQFQFIAPPTPGFRPQSTWGGSDFYRAHAANADPSLFDHAWRYVREHHGRGSGLLGVGIYDARRYHSRAYGSMGLNSMSPAEIGHAAAYEAYRTWLHNSYIYEPLSGDLERQREALVGLAVAEATRLMQNMVHMDGYGRTTAVDAAASTASNIFDEDDDDERHQRRSRRGSFSGAYDDPYINDDPLMFRRSRRHSHSYGRQRSHSMLYPPGGQYPGSVPIQGNSLMVPNYGGGYPGYMPSSSYPGPGMQMGGYGQTLALPQPHYGTSTMVAYDHRPRRSSVSVPIPMTYSSGGGPPGVPIVVSTSSRKHKHRHSHSSSRRSRSSDPTLRIEYPGSGYARSGY